MEMKDFAALLENKCETERIHGVACICAMEAIIKAYNEYDDKDLRYSVRAAIKSTTETRLAMQSARRDFNECYETECNKASLKE